MTIAAGHGQLQLLAILVFNRPLSFEVDTTLVPIKLVELKVGIVVVEIQHTAPTAGSRHVERAPGDLLVWLHLPLRARLGPAENMVVELADPGFDPGDDRLGQLGFPASEVDIATRSGGQRGSIPSSSKCRSVAVSTRQAHVRR